MRICIAMAIVTPLSACNTPTTVLVHVSAPVTLETLSGRVITDAAAEYAVPEVNRPALPGDVRIVLPDVASDMTVQLVGYDASQRRFGVVVGTRSVAHEVVDVDVTLGADGGWLWTLDASGTVDDLWGVSGSATSIYAVGARGTILRRKDGGPWSSLLSGRTELLSAVTALGDTVLVVGNLGCSILRSTDGGDSFAPVDRCATGGTSEALLAIWGDPRGQAITCGDAYRIYLSVDAGASWTPTSPAGGRELDGVWSNGANQAYAVGPLGRITESTDGGQSFSAIDPLPTGATLKAVWGSAASDVDVVGTLATIYHFNGQTWSVQNAATTADLDGVTGWGRDAFAVGSLGTIVHSSDGGSTWTPQISGTTQYLHAAWQSANGEVWIVGANGTIVHGR